MEGLRITAAFDSGDVRSPEFVEKYCREKEIERCGSLEDLAGRIDAAMVLSVNWDTAVDKTVFLLERGVPVLLDKPLAGNLRDLERLSVAVEESRTMLLGGSGWRFAVMSRVAADGIDARDVRNVEIGCPGPFFYYGVHATGAALGLLGPGISEMEMREFVRGESAVMGFRHSCGAEGTLRVSLPPVNPRRVSFALQGEEREFELEYPEIRRLICSAFVDLVRSGTAPLSPDELSEPVRMLIAAWESMKRQEPVRMEGLASDVAFDGKAFAEIYRRDLWKSTALENTIEGAMMGDTGEYFQGDHGQET
jgi:predicted dehydrogenase